MAPSGSSPSGGPVSAGSLRPAAEADINLNASTEPSLGELISTATSDLSDLFRSEIELAKVELKEEAQQAGKAAAFMGGAGVVAYTAFTLLCFAAAWGLSEIVPEGVAFLIVGLVVAAVAGVLFLSGKKKLESFSPVPEQTVETLQEDVQWAKQLRS